MSSDYRTETFSKVSGVGVGCEFNDMRIGRSSVRDGRYQYEVAGDDDSDGDRLYKYMKMFPYGSFKYLPCKQYSVHLDVQERFIKRICTINIVIIVIKIIYYIWDTIT